MQKALAKFINFIDDDVRVHAVICEYRGLNISLHLDRDYSPHERLMMLNNKHIYNGSLVEFGFTFTSGNVPLNPTFNRFVLKGERRPIHTLVYPFVCFYKQRNLPEAKGVKVRCPNDVVIMVPFRDTLTGRQKKQLWGCDKEYQGCDVEFEYKHISDNGTPMYCRFVMFRNLTTVEQTRPLFNVHPEAAQWYDDKFIPESSENDLVECPTYYPPSYDINPKAVQASNIFKLLIEKEMNEMAENMKENDVVVLPSNRVVIAVTFVDAGRASKPYHYWAERDQVKVKDWVVVKSPKGYTCAQVVQVGGFTKYELQRANKWIVCVVDTVEYDRRVLRERAVQDIKNRLRERREEMEEIAVYQMLAKNDPIMSKMLETLNRIDTVSTEELKQLTGPSLDDLDEEPLL